MRSHCLACQRAFFVEFPCGGLTPEQARRLIDAIAETRGAPLYATALVLGLRQGELLGLTSDDIDLDVGTMTVRHTLQRYGGEYHLDAPKTERSRRTLGLPANLVQVLHAHRVHQLAERLRPVQHGKAIHGILSSVLRPVDRYQAIT